MKVSGGPHSLESLKRRALPGFLQFLADSGPPWLAAASLQFLGLPLSFFSELHIGLGFSTNSKSSVTWGLAIQFVNLESI